MSKNDLQALFANVRPKSRAPSSTEPAGRDSIRSSAAAPFGSVTSPPPFSAVNPQHMPNDASMNPSATPPNTVTGQNLLNLLNFGTTKHTAAAPTQAPTKAESGSQHSTSGLVASMKSPLAGTPGEDQGGGAPKPTPDSAQNGLLNLLSMAQSKASKSASIEATPATPKVTEIATKEQGGKENKPIFTYTNPFESLNASRGATPQPAPAAAKPPQSPMPRDVPITSIESGSDIQRADSPLYVAERKKLTPRSASARAGRLAREGSMKSVGTPEPVVKEETSPAPNLPVLPIRNANGVPPAEEAVVEQVTKGAKASLETGAEEWEDAEDSPATDHETRNVPVYNFPIKPFVSITLNLDMLSQIGIRDDSVMEISRLKKEFDQIDRSLAAATTKYIAYALVKNGGMRIIRQDDGTDHQVFKHSGDRVFNISFCSTAVNAPPLDHQAVLGTGVSGTVYYATVSKDGNDLFEKNDLDSESLAFPAWPPAEETSAGGLLKTRAKRSSRHPEYFAIGRGKSIHIIWPANAMASKYGISDANRQVDMEKLYQERNLQISTGKAGKDFAFSEDDTLIVSLDKTGRLRFWDIRELTDEANATANKVAPIKIDVPLLSLSTASPAEKSWPTSVLFVDKSRPYTRGSAQRYVLVGLRQNHTLQLWDIALGKAVQELNFPHENETDGICSVNYHPASGIIVVAHPSRNSLFFIHLSAPKYALSAYTTQAEYVQGLAVKDPEVPKPDSTACMSGVREISFASKGQLRNVELLPIHKDAKAAKESDEKTALFELYAVHSRGVTCLTITKEDLGWDANSKVINSIDAAKAGIVTLKELKLGSIVEETANTRDESPTKEPPSTGKSSKKKSKRVSQPPAEPEAAHNLASQPAKKEPISLSDHVNGDLVPPKESKKSKKKTSHLSDLQPTVEGAFQETPPTVKEDKLQSELPILNRYGIVMPDDGRPQETAPRAQQAQASQDTSNASRTFASPSTSRLQEQGSKEPDNLSIGISGDWLDKEMERLKHGVRSEFKKELNNLYKDIQNDRIAQDSAATARQETVLRLVSQTLTTNVDRSLGQIVGHQIQMIALPALSQLVTEVIRDNINASLPRAHQAALDSRLPQAVVSAMKDPALVESIAAKVADRTESQWKAWQIAGFKEQEQNMLQHVQTIANVVEARISPAMRELQAESKRSDQRMHKLTETMQSVVSSVESLAQSQQKLQHQFEQLAMSMATGPAGQVSTSQTGITGQSTQATQVKPMSKEEQEVEEIQGMMQERRYEEAAMRWIRSGDRVETLFDAVFCGYTPDFLQSDVSSLAALSVALALCINMQSHLRPRIDYIAAALSAVHLQVSKISCQFIDFVLIPSRMRT